MLSHSSSFADKFYICFKLKCAKIFCCFAYLLKNCISFQNSSISPKYSLNIFALENKITIDRTTNFNNKILDGLED